MFLYLTADKIGVGTGGGAVTHHESEALKTLGETRVLSHAELEPALIHRDKVWAWDDAASRMFPPHEIKLAHLYAGTFPDTVSRLQREAGTKVAYTVAAHDLPASRAEHEKWGIPFARLYPHLCQSEQWERYIEGYRLADVIVVPSVHSRNAVRNYGGDFKTKRIEVIPHGVDIPDSVRPLPKMFSVGYLGAYTADKGVIYLLQAWGKLAYHDAVLILGGRDSASQYVLDLVDRYCPKASVVMRGWVRNLADFYGGISLYVQPSVTEGWGLEVSEAMAHGRAVLVSKGAGASDLIPEGARDGMTFTSGGYSDIAAKIDQARTDWDMAEVGADCREIVKDYTWDKVRARYVKLWKELLG